MTMRKVFLLFIVWSITVRCFADTVFLKSGKDFSGKILEKTEEKVRLEIDGVPLTFWSDSIDHVSVEGESVAATHVEKTSVPHEDGAKLYQVAFEKMKEPPAKGDLQIHIILQDIERHGWQDDARVISLLNDNREAIDLFKKATQQISDGYILGNFKDTFARNEVPANMKKYFSYLPLLDLVLIEANQFLAKKEYQAAQDNLLAAALFIKHFAEQKDAGSTVSIFVWIAENKMEPVIVHSLKENSLGRFYYEKLLQYLLAFPNDQERAQNLVKDEAMGFYLPIAKRNNFITAAAVRLYKIDNGNLPERLDDLVPQYLPKVPEDAFDNFKPVKYVQKNNGYLIYSLGPDRVDQKGEVVCGFEKMIECDIALFVTHR